MDPYDGYTNEATAYSTVFMIIGVTLGVTVVIAAISWLLVAIPLAALFRKTGIEPWKAWIPFYSTYTWLRLGGQSGHWVWLSLLPYGSTITAVFLYLGMHSTGKAFAKDSGFLVLGIFLPWVWLFVLGFGKDVYRPELITAAGLSGPLEGTGAPVRADGIAVSIHYGAVPLQQQPTQYPPTQYPPAQQPPSQQPPTWQPPTQLPPTQQ